MTPPDIEHLLRHLPGQGIHLSCRCAGPANGPLLVFLHGFPEAAFVWDDALRFFSRPENGGYRCIAPNLRGYERSSQPTDVRAYHARHLIQDISELIALELGQTMAPRVKAVVAHDWGGAVAWGFAALHPSALERLVILNAPHPATFQRELAHNPQQQNASAYMHFLARPDASARLAENDFARLWPFFENMGATMAPHAWLTPALRDTYRAIWRQGLHGPCAYYAASPLRPPLAGDAEFAQRTVPAKLCRVNIRTQVIWGMNDSALPPALLDGLADWVPDLHIDRLQDATHWLLHEQPEQVLMRIQKFLKQ